MNHRLGSLNRLILVVVQCTYSQHFLDISNAEFSDNLNGTLCLGTHKEDNVGMEDLAVKLRIKNGLQYNI